MADSKNNIIKKVYYEHFGSIKRTLKEARAIDANIKEKDIKAWADRDLQRKINLTGQNSFVASRPRQEYQVDLFEMPISILTDMRYMSQEEIDYAQKMYTNQQRRRKGEGMAGHSSAHLQSDQRCVRGDTTKERRG